MLKLRKTGLFLILTACCLFFTNINEGMAQFTIGPGGSILVRNGGSMRIGTDFLIQSNASSSGHLADRNPAGDVTITGDITVERYMTANMWHNAASPVSNENSSAYSATDLVFYYDETLILNDWNFGWVMYSGGLDVFRGYDVRFYTNPITVNYTATGAEDLNTGSYSLGVTITDVANGEIPSHKGWNLPGNPYPSPVDWLASGWGKADINDAKYIWDGSNSIYTIFIGGGSPIGLNGGTRYIPANQGFWVQAIQNGTISISNAVRLGIMSGTPDFYKNDDFDYPLVSLLSKGNGYQDEIIVRFIEGTTADFDINFDASKLFSPDENVPQLSINVNGQKLALNTLSKIEEDLEISLDFQCGKAGYYFVELNDRTFLDDTTTFFLKDEFEQEIVNLKELGSYGFYHDPYNKKGRFKAYFNPSADVLNNVTPETYFTVTSYQDMIMVNKNTVKDISGEIYIYNMLGQVVGIEKLSNDTRSSIQVDGPTGCYIVSLLTEQHMSNTKVLIYNTE